VTNISVSVTADVARLGSLPDLGYNYADWVYGLTTFDLVLINKHILGIQQLSGYRQLAADANKSGSVTTFDLVEFQRLLLGIYQKLPAYDRPWIFIPEFVTLNQSQTLNFNFDGLNNDDNPFNMSVNGQQVTGAPYINSNWSFLMKTGSGRNGFDAVKLGNVNGAYPLAPEGCPDEAVTFIVPNVFVAEDTEFEMTIAGHNFANVSAFQLGLRASAGDFEYVQSGSGELSGFDPENSVGGISQEGQDGLKVVWLSPTMTPKTVTNGTALMTFRLRAKKDITNLQQAIGLDEENFETMFLTDNGDCIGNLSLQASVNLSPGERSSGEPVPSPVVVGSSRLVCLPNPARDALKIVYDAESDFNGTLNFYDVRGVVLHSREQSFRTGRNIVELREIARFPTGVIHVSVQGDKTSHVARIIKE
jgi:hypothetical protein